MTEGVGPEEAALVRRIRKGDEGAFSALVEQHMRGAFTVAFRILGNREDAEDVVQEAFVRLAERIDEFDDRRAFRPWFYRVVANIALNARRARTVRRTEDIPVGTASPGATPEDEAGRAQIRTRVEEALDTLPERQRTIFLLAEVEGMSSTEVGEIVGCAPGTVRWHLHKARETLRDVLTPMYGRTE